MPETLLVPLSGRDARALDAARRILAATDPVVFPLGQLANGRGVLRQPYEVLALVGAPPTEELGYGLSAVVALLGRPKRVVRIDLRSEDVVSSSLLSYLGRSAPFTVGQLAGSALAVVAQLAASPFARRAPQVKEPSGELRKLVYLHPAVGATSEVGGSITHCHGVIRALTEEGVAVEPFTTSPAITRTALREPDSPCRWQYVRVPRLAKAVAASAAAAGDAVLVRAALSAARDADAIYQRHARFSMVGAFLARLSGRPLILEYNGSEEFVERHWSSTKTPLRSRIKPYEDAALAAAARVVVVSEVDSRSLQERGVERERIIVNANGVDAERFAVGGGAAVRRRHGIDAECLVIGFVGTFGPWHGAPVLARAFSDVTARIPTAHLLLVGDGREREAAIEILRNAGNEDRVTVTGQVPPSEIPAHLDACDILVAPHVPLADGAEFFGSPTKLFEYMAAGKAIVASSLGQIGDVLEHRVTGWLVTPGEVDDLRHGLLAVAHSAELRSTLGANARQRAIDHHSWRLNARRILDGYTAFARGAA